jgi:hypothetical protein
MDPKIILEVCVSIFLAIPIILAKPDYKLHDFIVELLSEKPYIFILYILTFFIAMYSPIIAILYGILILVLDNNIVIVWKKENSMVK